MKQHNISVTHKMVKKIKTDLDLSKATGPDYIPVVVLKNCKPELSYLLDDLVVFQRVLFSRLVKVFIGGSCN